VARYRQEFEREKLGPTSVVVGSPGSAVVPTALAKVTPAEPVLQAIGVADFSGTEIVARERDLGEAAAETQESLAEDRRDQTCAEAVPQVATTAIMVAAEPGPVAIDSSARNGLPPAEAQVACNPRLAPENLPRMAPARDLPLTETVVVSDLPGTKTEAVNPVRESLLESSTTTELLPRCAGSSQEPKSFLAIPGTATEQPSFAGLVVGTQVPLTLQEEPLIALDPYYQDPALAIHPQRLQAISMVLVHPPEGPPWTREERAEQREAIRRALVEHDLLLFTRRRIPLPISRKKAANIP
jgi:hypothetical protein